AEATARRRKPAGESSYERIRSSVASMRKTLEKGLEQLRVPVRPWKRRRPRAEEQRTVGRVQQHRHHVRPAQLAEDAGRTVELAEALDSVGAYSGPRDEERYGIAGVDHLRVGGGCVIAGHADERPGE